MHKLVKEVRMKIPGDRHLVVEKHTVSYSHPLHWHSFFEVEIVLTGSGRYVINDNEYKVQENAVFFLTSTDFHFIEVDGICEVLNISFDDNAVDEKTLSLMLSSATPKSYILEPDEHARMICAAELLQNEAESGGTCQRELLRYILTSLFRHASIVAADANYEHCRGIKKAITYMEMHFKENITLEFIASEAGYNKNYFSELFKKITGETYIEKLTRLRISYARTLLANGFSVTDAAHLSGFGSLSGFLSAFKKSCGMSPREYRLKNSL